MQYRSATAGLAVGALLAVLAGAAKPAQAAWTVGQNFTGSSQSVVEFFEFPPDSMGAVGPNQFAELVNGRFAVYDKTGNLLQSSTQGDFWRAAGVTIAPGFAPSPFDPRIVYDKSSGHWFAAALTDQDSPNSRFLIGVSNTSDP